MKVGVISDIHGNKPALDAALAKLYESGVEAVVCTGDMAGVLGWNSAVVERVQDETSAAVVGNHDLRVVPDGDFTPESDYEQIEHQMVTGQLDASQREWLGRLPERTWYADSLQLVHSHPDPEKRWTGDDRVPPKHFVKMGAYTEGDVLLLGHTHEQHAVDLDNFSGQSGLALNPGSVGVPYYRSAKCAVVETDTQEFELLEAEYDEERVVSRLKNLGVYDDLQSIAKSRQPHNRRNTPF